MSRTDARSNSLRRRSARTIPATIAGVILLALGVALAWLAVDRLVTGSWPGFLEPASRWAIGLTWGSAATLAISLTAVVVGLILLAAAIKPGQPNAMKIDAASHGGHVSAEKTEMVITRRAVAKLATARADQVDGVESVSATVTGRRVVLSVRSPSEQRDQLGETVTTVVQRAFVQAGFAPVPKITTRVRTRSL